MTLCHFCLKSQREPWQAALLEPEISIPSLVLQDFPWAIVMCLTQVAGSQHRSWPVKGSGVQVPCSSNHHPLPGFRIHGTHAFPDLAAFCHRAGSREEGEDGQQMHDVPIHSLSPATSFCEVSRRLI